MAKIIIFKIFNSLLNILSHTTDMHYVSYLTSSFETKMNSFKVNSKHFEYLFVQSPKFGQWKLGHSMSNNASLDMTHFRIWSKFAKLSQYIRYDNPENFSLIPCMD